MKTPASFTAALLSAILLAGCQSHGLFFATETAGGLNVAGSATAPSTVSLDYHRAELAVIPKNTSGRTYSVYGGTDNDYSWGSGLAISQTFATGQAAVAATNGTPDESAATSQDGPLVFTTGTIFGLNLHFADATSQTPGFLAGYRRAEAVWIHTNENATETSPVYADISIVELNALSAAGAEKFPGREPVIAAGARIQQKFATGLAAIKTAAKPSIKAKLDAAAGVTAATKALTLRTDYAQKLAAITDTATQTKILDRARGAFAGENVEMRSDYPGFVNVTVVNLAPAPLAKLEAALSDLVP